MPLTSYENRFKQNIIFYEPKEYTVKNSKLKYQRIKIETKYPKEKKKGQLVIGTPFLFSFGVKERLNQETNQLTGYSGKNENEKAFFEAINKFPEICQQHLEEDFGPDADSCLNQFSLLETN